MSVGIIVFLASVFYICSIMLAFVLGNNRGFHKGFERFSYEINKIMEKKIGGK